VTGAVTWLRHGKLRLALHHLRDGRGRALLLLHGLGEESPKEVPSEAAAWPGPVHALDFTGHGASEMPVGGGYTCEQLLGDADAALAALGSATLLGRGLGAYVALLLAGGRPDAIRGAVLCDGPGLSGGGPEPGPHRVPSRPQPSVTPPDPFAKAELERDVRPPDYAEAFADLALRLSGLPHPIAVAARERPPWLAAVAARPGVALAPPEEALARLR